MVQLLLGLQEIQLSKYRPVNKWIECKEASAMRIPKLGQLMSQDNEGQENFTELAVLG